VGIVRFRVVLGSRLAAIGKHYAQQRRQCRAIDVGKTLESPPCVGPAGSIQRPAFIAQQRAQLAEDDTA